MAEVSEGKGAGGGIGRCRRGSGNAGAGLITSLHCSLARPGTLHDVTHVALCGRTLSWNANHSGRGVSTLLSEMARPPLRLSRPSGELRVFIGMRHEFVSFRRPRRLPFEYTVQSFSVIEELAFSRVRLQFREMDSIEAVEEIDGDFDGRVVFTCEHASAELPEPWTWPGEDRWLVDTHWASDIGAAAFTRRAARLMNAPAVLSRFSRLLVDPNRPLDSDTLFRENAEGRTVHLNEALLEAERSRRIDRFYLPYHAAVSAMVERAEATRCSLSTPLPTTTKGEARALEIGVLFDHDEEPAYQLVRHLEDAGFPRRCQRALVRQGGAGLFAGPTRPGIRAMRARDRGAPGPDRRRRVCRAPCGSARELLLVSLRSCVDFAPSRPGSRTSPRGQSTRHSWFASTGFRTFHGLGRRLTEQLCEAGYRVVSPGSPATPLRRSRAPSTLPRSLGRSSH